MGRGAIGLVSTGTTVIAYADACVRLSVVGLGRGGGRRSQDFEPENLYALGTKNLTKKDMIGFDTTGGVCWGCCCCVGV